MDVRCDRCQTEYELDDDAVAGAGASVQCTTCGHTFVVSRMPQIELRTTPSAGVPPAGFAPAPAPPDEGRVRRSTPPPIPEWVLATESGQTHRLRDLTTLQKWIVERRVSRADRVSNRGGAWRSLGEVEELRPFFDVVEQADRQTANVAAQAAAAADAMRASRSATVPSTPRGLQSAASRGQVAGPLGEDDTFSMREGRRARFDDNFPDSIPADEDLSLLVKPKRTGLKVFGGLVFLGLAAGAWYLGFREPHGFRLASGSPVAPPAPVVPAPPPVAATPPPPPPPPPQAPALAPTPPPAAAAAPAAPPAPEKTAAPEPDKAAEKTPEKAPDKVADKGLDRPPEKPAEKAVASDSKPRSYEHIVADADHALENGQTAKAQKLYDEALSLQPSGVAAVTGEAYVAMDKHHTLAAIDLFKKALDTAPHFAPALFGLGEAYRAQGKTSQALEAYKSYLDQSPTGSDAPAARRQIKELGEASPPPSREGPSAVIPEGAASAKTEPPATAPPPIQ